MAFCDIKIKRNQNDVEVYNKRGEVSSLFPQIVKFVESENIYPGREWFFDKLLDQKKIKTKEPQELALGLYSIAYHSGKSEGYWQNKIDKLLPKKHEIQRSAKKLTPALKMYENFIQTNTLYVGEDLLPLVGESEYFRHLTKMLVKMNPKIRTEFSNNLFNTILGRLWEFGASRDLIRDVYNNADNINDANGLSINELNYNLISTDANIETIVHELVHRTLQKEYDKEGDFYKQINDLYDYAVSNASDTQLYGYYEPKEFLAEALSDPKFMEELNNIPYQNETIFSYLMTLISSFINNLLNIELNSNSVLASVVRASEQILNRNLTELSQENPVSLSELQSEVVSNWTNYFPNYDWMNLEQKQIAAKLIEEGKLTLTCKL